MIMFLIVVQRNFKADIQRSFGPGWVYLFCLLVTICSEDFPKKK